MRGKRLGSALLTLALLATLAPALGGSASAVGAGDGQQTGGFSIDKTFLRTGDPIKVINPDKLSLRFLVDGAEAGRDMLTLLSDYYEKWITVQGYRGETLVSEDRAYFSKLPVIYINTEDGAGITSKSEYKKAEMTIQNNSESDAMMYSGDILIKGRGNTTWGFPKKPYRIKLDKKADLFGMGENKNWVLLANYLDESLLRNTTASQLSQEFGLETMETVWTEVVLNGGYVGNYQLCEQIRVGETRVDVFDWEDEAENVASNGTADFIVANSHFTEPLYKKNVISLIGKDADGNSTYTNFTTILCLEDGPIRTVVFDANGGSGMMPNKPVTEGGSFMLPDCSFIAPVGMRFQAWSVNGKMYEPGTICAVTEDTAVTAIWESVSAQIISVAHTTAGTNTVIYCSAPDAVVCCAAYDISGRMVDMKSQRIAIGQSSYTFTVGMADSVRVFVLDKDGCPLCESRSG